MKNLPLILSAVLLIAVGVLYYLHFSGNKAHDMSTGSSASTVPSDIKIAYINSDSVLKHYEYLEVNRKTLEEKTQKLEQEFRNRAQGLQNEIGNYQRNVNNLTLSQAKALEEDLAKKQQNLQLYQQSLSQQLQEEEGKLNKELYDRITNFLKKYGAENGLQLVLKYDPSSDVLYGGEALNITNDVVKGLNELYKEEKKGPKTDSVATKTK
jgi:outer membrane protein